MPRPAAILGITTLLLLSSGCGTMLNVTDGGLRGIPPEPPIPLPLPHVPFGGVWQDLARVSQSVARVPEEPGWGPISCAFFLADMPLSLAGDVVTMPIVLWQFTQNLTNPDQPDRNRVDRGTQ